MNRVSDGALATIIALPLSGTEEAGIARWHAQVWSQYTGGLRDRRLS
jgi:hypothetical protein